MDNPLTKKIYIDNPYLKETYANIIDQSLKDNKFHIKLDRTIFFPYLYSDIPSDLGLLDDKKVIDVYENGDEIIHVVAEDIEEVKIPLSIDWENRYDLMQQHTGLLILSATFKNLFNAATIDFHIGENYSTIDLELSNISEDEICQLEILSNKMVQSNFKIANEPSDSNNIIELNLSQPLGKKGKTRVVIIDNIGTFPYYYAHVNNTAEIGLIKILKHVSYNGSTRINFICGNRAIKDYITKSKSINNIALELSSDIPDILDKLLQLKEELTLLKEKIKSQENENADRKD